MARFPSHVKLDRLIPLAAQLAATLHLEPDDLAPADHGLRKTLKEGANGLFGYAGDLQAAFESYNGLIGAALNGRNTSPEFAGSLGKLRAHLTDRSCLDCPKGKPPCKPNESTNEAVHLGGNCIKPIMDMYQDIQGWVFQLWDGVCGGAPKPALRFSTGYLDIAEKPAVFEDFFLTGNAQIVEEASPTTTIRVAFYDGAFNWRQFSVLPYLIFHEIVCHGLQDVYRADGAAIPRSDRYQADASCLWSEGWMDTVAHRLSTRWLNERGQRHHISGTFRMRKAVRSTGEYHDARYSSDGRVLSPERHHGRRKFDRILERITSATFSDASALDLLVRFSILLNARIMENVVSPDTPNLMRRRIVDALDLLSLGSDPEEARAIMQVFSDFPDGQPPDTTDATRRRIIDVLAGGNDPAQVRELIAAYSPSSSGQHPPK